MSYNKEWYQTYYQKNKEKLNERSRGYYVKHLEKRREYNRTRKHETPELWLLNVAKSRSKRKGLDFNLDINDIVIPLICPILGITIFSSDGSVGPHSPSLDRRDTTKGYVKGNVAVISHRANRLKSDMSLENVRNLMDYMSCT